MLAFALLPLSVYFLMLAYWNTRRVPVILSGHDDLFLLFFALTGFFILGPGKLLLPIEVLVYWGVWVWPFFIAFYLTFVHWILKQLPPRIVIYRAEMSTFRNQLDKIAKEIDSDAEWVNDVLFLPRRGVRVFIHSQGRTQTIIVSAIGSRQNVTTWHHLQENMQNIRQEFAVSDSHHFPAIVLGCVAMSLIAVSGYMLFQEGGHLCQTACDLWFSFS